MDVRLLGPVTVVVEGRELSLRQRRQRALLALLALRPGETLAVDRLVEELWGAEAPRTAVASLHNAVSQLRKLLRPETVVRRDPGYALDTERVSVDVDRFEHLLAEARAARSMRDEQTATTILREALGLWRGPALADLAYEPFAQAEIRRLEELRQGALEERIAADLALGRHGDLIAELESLVAQEPLRERLQGQLMLALYRAERQADALAAYRAARATLVGELGIEPGPELRQLHAAILRQDETLLLAGASPMTSSATMQFRRLATILVADAIVASETGEVDPEALHRLLDRWFETAVAVVGGHGGTAERMAGDAVMAVFGVSTGDEAHALRAARAAVDVQSAVTGLNADLEPHGTRLDARIGIATGEVLVSGAGSRRQLVTGEAIGVAAALQQAAAPGTVVIGPLTGRLVGGAATVEALGELELRGRSRSLAAFRLIDVSAEQPPLASVLDTPVIGRKRELRGLRAALRECRATSTVRGVCLLGPAGIGKSRLAREVARGAKGFDVLVARCLSYGEGVTYWPLRQLVGEDRDAIAVVLDGDSDADLIADRLARLDGPAPEIAWAFRRWCEARARSRPLLLVVDDLHWAEPTFLDLLEHLAEHGSGAIVLLGIAREELLEERPSFLEACRIVLEGLTIADTEALVDGLLGGAPLPSDSRARVFEAAEGNPLFLEQLVALATEGDPLGADRPLPATVQALLAARLDRLGPGERAVLERASVVGRDFTSEQVTALLGPEAVPTVARHLASLERRGFIRRGTDDELRFRHVLVQEATYRAAPKALRAELHERFADVLDRAEGSPDVLVGYHLERAYTLRTELAPPDRRALRLAEDAGRRLGAAGIRAWQRFDAPAAINLFQRATSLLPASDPGRLELLCELGAAFKFVLDDTEAEAALVEASQTATTAGSRRFHLRAELERAWPRYLRGEVRGDEIVALTEEALPLFESVGDDRGLGRTWLLLAAVHSLRGRWAACKEAAARALDHQARSGFPGGPSVSMLAASVYAGPEPVDVAIAYCEQLIERDATATTGPAFALVLLAHLEAMRGRFENASDALQRSREFREERGTGASPDWVGASAAVEMLAGRAPSAEAILRDECARLDERGDRAWLATLEAALAEALYAQGRFDEAAEHARRARALSPSDDLTAETAWRRALAKTCARTGADAEGLQLAREAVAMLEPTDALNDRSAAVIDLAEVLYLTGHEHEAEETARSGLGLLLEKGNIRGAELARERLEELANRLRNEGSPVGLPSPSG